MKKPSQEAKEAAETYLKLRLGDRKGMHVLEGLDEETADEIIEECAVAFQKFADSQK